jgi:hypothetical protein
MTYRNHRSSFLSGKTRTDGSPAIGARDSNRGEQRRSNKENREPAMLIMTYRGVIRGLLLFVIVGMRACTVAEAPITPKLKDRAMDARGYLTGR